MEEYQVAYIEVKHEFKRYQMGETQIIANNDVSSTHRQRISDLQFSGKK